MEKVKRLIFDEKLQIICQSDIWSFFMSHGMFERLKRPEELRKLCYSKVECQNIPPGGLWKKSDMLKWFQRKGQGTMEHILTMNYIRQHWEPQVGSKQAELTVWDVASEGYRKRKIADKKESPSLKLVTEKGMWNENSEILDVGCGAGLYSVAFAKECKRVVGTDVSGGMIEAAKENAQKYGTSNTEFYQIDWHSFALERMGWEKNFDLVFANMTPAVQSCHTLELMNQASRGWCFLSKPTAWKHSITYELIQMLGLWEEYRTFDIDMLCAYDVLRLQGRFPYVEYGSDVWINDWELEEACESYIRRIEMKKLLTLDQKKKIREYLERKTVEGRIYDETEVTISMLYWKV